MIEQALTFISIDWLKPLAAKLKKIRDERADEIQKIGDIFGDPQLLARYYVEPTCQHHNPADRDEDDATVAQVKMPIFEFINNFLNKEIGDSVRDGRIQQFILADAGMGKTSLLVMLKLAHVLAFWAMIIVWAIADVGARFIAPQGRDESRPYYRNDDHGRVLA